MLLNRLLVLLATLILVACSDDRMSSPSEDPRQSSLPGVYSGEFPCDGCPGIPSRLWLRSDGRFFFKQRYLVDDTREAMDAYSLGKWRPVTDGRMIELMGPGPHRVFARVDSDTLAMQTASPLEHRLTRDPGARPFSDTIRLTGEVRQLGDSMSFTECSTGLEAPIAKIGDYTRLRHQYRSVARSGKPTIVELDGRFSWSGNGAAKLLTIERFITVRANGAC